MAALSPALIWELTKRDFSERFAGSLLGSTWAMIWPLVSLFIYIVIFGRVMGGRLPGNSALYSYGVYVAAGLIPWVAFAGTVGRSSSLFLEKRHIISKINISLPSLLLYVNLSETITFLISIGLLFVFLSFGQNNIGMEVVLLPYVFYLQQLFAFGIGLLAATLTVFVRDLKEVVGIVLQLWFWFTPIVYVQEILPDMVKKVIVFNPSYVLIEAYHKIIVFGDAPPLKGLIVMTVLTHGLVAFSYFTFRNLQKDLRDFL
ncbi:MAG: ABC transporter permease [Methanosarcinaceae archaeon]|nr:ABC transporter permease [Methanosarcinaceae archaeon]